MDSRGVHQCTVELQGAKWDNAFFFLPSNPIYRLSFFIYFFLVESCDSLIRHHQHGRWQARIGRVAGNKDLYLGTFSKTQIFKPPHAHKTPNCNIGIKTNNEIAKLITNELTQINCRSTLTLLFVSNLFQVPRKRLRKLMT